MDLTDRRSEFIHEVIIYFSLALNFTYPVLDILNFSLRTNLKNTIIKENAVGNLRQLWLAFAQAGEINKIYPPLYATKNYGRIISSSPKKLMLEVKIMTVSLPDVMAHMNPRAIEKIASSENLLDFVDFFQTLKGMQEKS